MNTPHGENSLLELRIGNQTSFAAADFLAPFRYAVTSGFDAFEWFPDRKPAGGGWDEADLNAGLRAELREAASRAGVRISVHARWTANPLLPEGCEALACDLELAKDLRAAVLNLHLYTERGVAAYVNAALPLLRAAREANLQVAIENTVETPPQDFNELFERLHHAEPAATENVGMCLDIGHANLCAPTRNNYLAYVDRLGPQVPIIHLHLHENWGDADTHLPLFTGPAATDPRGIEGLLRRLQARGFAGSAILEQWPDPPALLNEARNRLLAMQRELRPMRVPDSGILPQLDQTQPM